MTQTDFLELRWLLHQRITEQTRERYSVSVQSSCQGKQGFLSRDDAQRAMHSESTRRSCEPYRCRHCGKWHVGGRSRA